MAPEVEFLKDLYRGTAPYYDRFRRPYPDVLFADLLSRLPVSGRGRLLDLACGTGQIAFSMAASFSNVVAVDQEPETVAFAEARAKARSAGNIEWVVGSAESVGVEGTFELVTIGTAFHRLNRPVVADRIRSWLQPRGGVALVWGHIPWQGEEAWQQTMAELFLEWITKLEAIERVPEGFESAMQVSHEQVLREAGYDYVGKFEFAVDATWTAESLIGFVQSTSLLSPAVLGDRAEDFRKDVTDRLLALGGDVLFRELATDSYEFARLPTDNGH